MSAATLVLRADAAPVLAALDEFQRLLTAAVESGDVLPEVVQRLVNDPERVPQLVSIRSERRSAAGASQLFTVFEPSDQLRGLLAAIRTGNVDLGIIENPGHVDPSSSSDRPLDT